MNRWPYKEKASVKIGKKLNGGELATVCQSLRGKHGIYVFFDKEKNPLYIGKSSRDLGQRILSSLKERKNASYVSYALTRTKSDTHIYEMYYIAKIKPPLNSQGKDSDDVNIQLEELDFSLLSV